MAGFIPYTQRYDPTDEETFKSAIPLLLEQLKNQPVAAPEAAPEAPVDMTPVPQTQSAAIQQTPQPRPLGPGQIGGTDIQRVLAALAERRM